MDLGDFGSGILLLWSCIGLMKSRKMFVLQELFCYQGFQSYSTVMAELLPPCLGAEESNRGGQSCD